MLATACVCGTEWQDNPPTECTTCGRSTSEAVRVPPRDEWLTHMRDETGHTTTTGDEAW